LPSGHDHSPPASLAAAPKPSYIRDKKRGILMADTNTDVSKMPFERAIEELESIVKRLEEGKVPLEESVAIYERGEVLKRRCEDLLRQAEARVEKITLDATGKPTGTQPLDVD
jgi:exodeoxyribonuclease VII small subunit